MKLGRHAPNHHATAASGRRARRARLPPGAGQLAWSDARRHQALSVPRPVGPRRTGCIDLRTRPVRWVGAPPADHLPVAERTLVPAFRHVGVPDWVAHRLWIATIMFLAGAGIFWTARLLGLGRGGALARRSSTRLSPFVLAYVSRTSLLLLPWAASAGSSASRSGRHRGRWRADGAASSAGAVARSRPDRSRRCYRRLRQRDDAGDDRAGPFCGSFTSPGSAASVGCCVAVTGRVAALCLAVSLWWISMLYGAVA